MRCAVTGAVVAIAVFVWLTLWADARNQRFYEVGESKSWAWTDW
jgi:hypothetical protein